MSSSLENAASTTEEEERESPPTDAAGVVAGDGVCSPSSEPDETGGVLQPLSGHTSCPGMYHSSGSEDSIRSDVVLFPAESSKIESTDSASVESSTAGDNGRTSIDGLESPDGAAQVRTHIRSRERCHSGSGHLAGHNRIGGHDRRN